MYTLLPGSIMRMNQPLRVNEYIQSPSSFFFAIMQSDANFVVYRGSGPTDGHGALWGHDHTQGAGTYFAVVQGDANFVVYSGADQQHQGDPVWASNATREPDGSAYFGAMQDDGNFVVYHGKGLGDQQDVIWSIDTTDPVVTFENVNHINYDLNLAKVVSITPQEISSEAVSNPTDSPQADPIGGSTTVTDSSSWSQTTHVHVDIDAGASFGIPGVFGASVEIRGSYDVTTSKWQSHSSTTVRNWQESFNVPPHTQGTLKVLMSAATVDVPFQLSGTVVYQSGVRAFGQVHGIYHGTNSSDIRVQYEQTGTPPGQASSAGGVKLPPLVLHLPTTITPHPSTKKLRPPQVALSS